MNLSAYYRLMRFHKPVGTLLLWIPTAWALWLVNGGLPETKIIVLLLLGTIIMRAAGCVVNDIADRHIDKHVKRTQERPITAATVSLPEALGLFIGLCFLAFLVVTQLPCVCFYYALPALMVTGLYPFCKRFLSAPQLVLGIAFSMGIPIAFVASSQVPNKSMLLLCLINFLWIVAYDTMYAMSDREEDKLIGVKSTAVLFGKYDKRVIAGMQMLFHGLWLVLARLEAFTGFFYLCWLTASVVLVYQMTLLQKDTPQDSIKAFSMNVWYGMIMWLGLL